MSQHAAPRASDFFRNRFIQAILLSGLFLQIGIWVRNFAILLYVMEKTGEDAFAISMISVAEFAPIFVFSFIGGTYADRWKPKRTMVWCDLLSAVSIFAVLLALVFGTWKVIFFATLVSAILSQFSQPSGMKLFKLHVPESQMQMGMSMYQTLMAVFMILGPMLGAFVFQNYGINVSIAVVGVSFLLSAAVLTFLPRDPEEVPQENPTTLREEMAHGFRYVWNNRYLTILGGCFMTAGLALGLIQPLGIFIVTERLGLDKSNLQWFLTANGVAMIVGGGLALGLSKKMTPQKLLALGLVVSSLTISVIGLSTKLWISLTAQFFSGFVLPGIQIGINTMILQNTKSQFVGRVNGILTPIFMGSMVITMSMAGLLKKTMSLAAVYQISAVLFIAGVLVMIPLYRLPAPAPTPASESES